MQFIFLRVLLIALLTCLSIMKGDSKAWRYLEVDVCRHWTAVLRRYSSNAAPMLGIRQMLVVCQYWAAVLHRCCAKIDITQMPVVFQHWKAVLRRSLASAAPVGTLGTVLASSTGITLELPPERYRASCKDWQRADYSAWDAGKLNRPRNGKIISKFGLEYCFSVS